MINAELRSGFCLHHFDPSSSICPKCFGISIIYSNHVAFSGTGFMPRTWNDGMLELCNNGQKRITSVVESRFLVRLWSIRINFCSFSMNVDIDARDKHPFVAIMALPDERLSFFDVERLLKAPNTTSRPPAPLQARRAYRPEGRACASQRIRHT